MKKATETAMEGEKKFLAIIGMHRSNTSMLARLVAHSGVPLGSRLVGANESNPYGHFEDEELVRLHENLLEANNSTWRPWYNRSFHYSNGDFEIARRIISDRFEELGDYWAFKVPHATLFLPLWERFPNARFLMVFRDPRSVYSSLLRRVGNQFYYKPYYIVNCMLTYVVYNELILSFYQKHRDKCFLVNADNVTDFPHRVFGLASRKLDIPMQFTSESLIDKKVMRNRGNSLVEFTSSLIAKYPAANRVFAELNSFADVLSE